MYVYTYVWLSEIKEEVELCENFEITYPGKLALSAEETFLKN